MNVVICMKDQEGDQCHLLRLEVKRKSILLSIKLLKPALVFSHTIVCNCIVIKQKHFINYNGHL